MKILIAGGAGCLGSNLIEHWLPQEHDIHVIDNFETGKRELIPNAPSLDFTEASIADFEVVKSVCDNFKPDIIINSAASYKDPSNWHSDVLTNVIGSINLSRVGESIGIKKLINFQTALCYGKPKSLPIFETDPSFPFTSYGISKTAGESFHFLSEVPTLSFRLANITGPRLSIGPIPTFYKRLKSNQSCFCSDTRRDFLDIVDFLSLMDKAISCAETSGIFNVSTGTSHSIKEIYDIVAEFLNTDRSDVPIVPAGNDDVKEVCLDPSKTCKAFGWSPTVPFRDIIINQLKWYEKFGVSDVFSHLKPAKNGLS